MMSEPDVSQVPDGSAPGTVGDGIRFEGRLTGFDALMWALEDDPALRSSITVVAVFDRSPGYARLENRMERVSRLLPRFRQRIVHSWLDLASPRWELDPDFDLRYHLRSLRAPDAGGLDALLRLAEPIAMQALDVARPLWQMVLVEGLDDDQAGLVAKLHHAFTDGVGAVKLASVLFDFEPGGDDSGVPMPDLPEEPERTDFERLRDDLDYEARRTVDLARRAVPLAVHAARVALVDPEAGARTLIEAARSVRRRVVPVSRPLSAIMTGRSLGLRMETVSIPLDEARAAAGVAGGTLNDFFLASVVGGLRRYHAKHGSEPVGLRLGLAIDRRTSEDEDLVGNQFVPASFIAPVQVSDPAVRIRVLHQMVAEERSQPALDVFGSVAGLFRRVPGATNLISGILRSVDVIASNVVGSPIPLYLAGSRVVALIPFGPRSGSALNLTLLSHVDRLRIGVNIDPSASPDVDILFSCLCEGFEETLALGTS